MEGQSADGREKIGIGRKICLSRSWIIVCQSDRASPTAYTEAKVTGEQFVAHQERHDTIPKTVAAGKELSHNTICGKLS